MISFPEPVSPVIRTGRSDGPTRRAIEWISRIRGATNRLPSSIRPSSTGQREVRYLSSRCSLARPTDASTKLRIDAHIRSSAPGSVGGIDLQWYGSTSSSPNSTLCVGHLRLRVRAGSLAIEHRSTRPGGSGNNPDAPALRSTPISFGRFDDRGAVVRSELKSSGDAVAVRSRPPTSPTRGRPQSEGMRLYGLWPPSSCQIRCRSCELYLDPSSLSPLNAPGAPATNGRHRADQHLLPG